MKKFLKVEFQYESDSKSQSLMTQNNLKRLIEEDMPYLKILFMRETNGVLEEIEKDKS